LTKSQEYRLLEAIGIPVPRWALVASPSRQAIDGLGPYVVTKPDRGSRGADVRIVNCRNVRWSPPRTAMGQGMGGVLGARVVQEFIYTGPWPRSYRVITLFGEVLACVEIEAAHSREPLPSRYAFRDLGDGVSIVSSGKGCTFTPVDDPGILDLAARAHRAFPVIPLLGIDIVRDHDTGALYVVEANSIGYTWHFSSTSGRALRERFGLDLEAQFDGRRRAARALAAATRSYAE
jgi:glutathione synthase/RimK-type ligase-like ATP-grasp enzyme